ncbi:fucolectin-like [Mercenaria mercenaria]|uniref:fucolectin-like n=1 Tax=Mercenaria mercenaria TaxID=6596 RepID=UPI00234EBBAC|nr:fucolectin-like [Mercenaria mercenaria]
MERMSIVIMFFGFTLVPCWCDGAVDDDELVAVIDALAAETRSAVDERAYETEDSCIVKNVALNKPAYISSKHSEGTVASLAVDGNLEQKLFGHGKKANCFHTHDTPSPNNWWSVDLQQVYNIERMTFYNRIDCCSERAIFAIQVGYSTDSMTKVGFVKEMGSTKTVTMPPNTNGRYVKLVQPGTSWFHLCEVEVYATPVCCSKPCRGRSCSADSSDARGYKCLKCARSSDYMTTGANCEETWVKLPSRRSYDLVPRQ